MADEILVDLNDVYEFATDLSKSVRNAEQGPALQVLATIALCERLDALIGKMDEFTSWYQAVSPRS